MARIRYRRKRKPQISPLRFAPVGKTKGRAVAFRKGAGLDGQSYERLLRDDCRSLHCAPPDFLSKLVALIDIMRFPLRETASVVLASAAKQKIRVRSGRDDKGRAVTFRKRNDLDGQSYERLLCDDHLPF
jgi:hypothetical protein